MDTLSLQTTTVESRIDSLARAVEEIRLVSQRVGLIIMSVGAHLHVHVQHIAQLGEVPGSRRSSTVSSGYDVGAALADGAHPNSGI